VNRFEFGLRPAENEKDESEHFDDGFSFQQHIFLGELFSDDSFDLLEDGGAEDELDGGIGDGHDVLLCIG
jgi:hypothetical protein